MNRLTALGHWAFLRKWLQYFVVPSDTLIILPSIFVFAKDFTALTASSHFWYVIYIHEPGPYKDKFL